MGDRASALADDARGDIQRVDAGKDWLVSGWFTPDYRPLAAKLAANLDAQGAPYHLFAKEKHPRGWDATRKASVVLEAMDAHPGKTLVLMDVDCIVGGDLAPLTQFEGDIAVAVKARPSPLWRGVVITLGSRVVAFRPTAKARSFVSEWHQLCGQSKTGSAEDAMAWAYVRRPDVSYILLDPRYEGREVDAGYNASDIVIWHESAHEKGSGRSLKMTLKHIERRWFRSGRTKAAIETKIP